MKKLLLTTLLVCLTGCGGSGGSNVTVTFSPADVATDQVYGATITATFSDTITAPSDWSTVFTVTVTNDTTNLCTSYSYDETGKVVTCTHGNLSKDTQYTVTISGLSGVTDGSVTFTTVSGLTVFITSTTHNGNFGGLSGADDFCATRATAAGLSGTFRAWLSADVVGVTPAVNAVDRIVDGKYVRTDGQTIASGLTELLSGTLQNPIDGDESENQVSAEYNVWTGSWADGTVCETDNCDGWITDLSGQDSIVGSSNQTTDNKWNFTDSSYNCDEVLHIYCFQISD